MSIREYPAPERGEEFDPSPLPRPRVDPSDVELPPRLRRPAPPSSSPAPPAQAPAPPVETPAETPAETRAEVPVETRIEMPVEMPAAAVPATPVRPEPAAVTPPAVLPAPLPPVETGEPKLRSPRRSKASQVEVRRARRVLRKIDTWSLFRFALLLYLCTLVVCMAAFVGMWLVASGAGAIPSIENFITQLFALKKFHFKAFQLFGATFAIGLIGVFVATLFTVLVGVLYNLITDVVGGIEITVLEENPVRGRLVSRREGAD